MSAISFNTVWSQELQAHWPKSWRFLAGRDLLLEAFTPHIFNVDDNTLFIRYAEDQDLRVSPHGLHIRSLALGTPDKRITEVFNQVIQIMEPRKLSSIEASFSHVHAINEDYDVARKGFAKAFYGPWIQTRPISDFALLWDERTAFQGAGKFSAGIVDESELIGRIAEASGTAEEVLRGRTPAWMKVRMPPVALFMSSRYSSDKDLSVDRQTEVPGIWRQWRESSDQLFAGLTSVEITAEKGELA